MPRDVSTPAGGDRDALRRRVLDTASGTPSLAPGHEVVINSPPPGPPISHPGSQPRGRRVERRDPPSERPAPPLSLQTKALTAATTGAIGELISQVVQTGGMPTIGRGTFAFAAANYVWSAPLFHVWYPMLEQMVPPAAKFRLIKRLLLDRLLVAPIYLGVYLPLVNALKGYPGGSSGDVLRNTLSRAFLGSLKFWTVVNSLNFTMVPLDFRSVVSTFAALVFNVYLATTTAAIPTATRLALRASK